MNPPGDFYRSHIRLPFIGPAGQQALGNARVLVVGAGGLGCPCLTTLAGAGVSTIGIADGDQVAISNLHRQPLYTPAEEGLPKAFIAGRKLQEYNPNIVIITQAVWVDAENVSSLLAGYDLIADCTDNFSTRYLLNDACVQQNKPLIYGAIHRGEGQVTVFNYNHGPTLRCLFPDAEQGAVTSCAETGAYNVTTAVTGTLMANEIIKIITGHPDILSGKLLQLNLLNGTQEIFGFSRTERGYRESLNEIKNSLNENSWEPAALLQRLSYGIRPVIIDVREAAERAGGYIEGLHLPLHTLLNATEFPFDPADEILLYCQRGQRSRIARQHLLALGFTRVIELAGGYEALERINPHHQPSPPHTA